MPPVVQGVARVGWALAGLGLAGVFPTRRWWPWLLLPIAVVAPSLWLAGDLDAALAGFLAVAITVAGTLAFGRRWWPPYLLIAAGVLLVLLLAPDAYAAFGLLFLVIEAGAAAHVLGRVRVGVPQRPIRGSVQGS